MLGVFKHGGFPWGREVSFFATETHIVGEVLLVPVLTKVSATSMRFWVMVPVLSTQSTDTAPRVSTDGNFLTRECFWRESPGTHRQSTVKTTGNSSGIIAIAKVTPDNMLSIKGRSLKLAPDKLMKVSKLTVINRMRARMAQ